MKIQLLLVAVFALSVSGCFKKGGSGIGAEPKTDAEKTIYTLGTMDARRLHNFDFSDHEFQVWAKGVKDALNGKTDKVDIQAFSKEISKLGDERSKRVAEREKKAAKGYIAQKAKEEGAETLESGVIFKELKAGDGDSPSADSMVKVHYHGTLRDGTVFDSSVDRGSPATFPLNRVISCWTEAVQKIKVGPFLKDDSISMEKRTLLEMMKNTLILGTARQVHKLNLLGTYGGKTGTTNDHKDGWFATVSPEYTTVVWVGKAPYLTDKGFKLTGATAAVPIWMSFAKKLEPLGRYSPADWLPKIEL